MALLASVTVTVHDLTFFPLYLLLLQAEGRGLIIPNYLQLPELSRLLPVPHTPGRVNTRAPMQLNWNTARGQLAIARLRSFKAWYADFICHLCCGALEPRGSEARP